MKKNFFKKLASGLALAMVVTSFAPAAPALAATATKIVKQGGAKAPTTVYVGKKVDYSLNNVYSTNTYKWFTSNGAVAKVTKTGGIVTPVATGEATIKVNAYKKSTGKFVKSFTVKLDVKERATSVDMGAEDFELAVGETKDLNAVKTPATSTDTLRYLSSDEKVATVDIKTGVVTAVAPGEATIKVASKGAWFTSNTSKYNKYDEVKVTVVDGITAIAQKTTNNFELTFATDAKDVKATDFAIVRDDTKQTIAVNTVKADGKVVTLTTFEHLTDGKAYTLTYNEKNYPFTVTDNAVATISFSPLTVAYEKATEIDAVLRDANGVELGRYNLTEALTVSKLDFTIETINGYTASEKLVLFKKGDTAKATATWHTFKYDDFGNELGAIKAEATITAGDQSVVNIQDQKYTIGATAPSLTDFKANTRLAIGDTGYKLYFYQKDSNNDVVTKTSNYIFESSNKDVLLVSTGATANDTFQTADLVAVAQGSAYVLVKNTEGKVLYSLSVNIVPTRVATSMELSATSLKLSNAQGANDVKSVTVTLRDQYGDKMPAPKLSTAVTTLSTPTIAAGEIALTANGKADGTIEFKGYNNGSVKAGTYVFKVETNKLPRTIAVTVQEPTAGADEIYNLVVSDNKVDVAFGATSKVKDVSIKVAALKGSVVNEYKPLNTATSIVVKRGATELTENVEYTVSGSAILVHAIKADGTNKVTKATVGSYSVAITIDGKNLSGGFVVEDTQAGVTAVRVKPELTATDVTDGVKNAFEFYYMGTKIALANLDIDALVDHADNPYVYNYVRTSATSNNYYIKGVTVNVEVVNADNNTYKVPVYVAIDKTITIN